MYKWICLVICFALLWTLPALAEERTLLPGTIERINDGDILDLDGDGKLEAVRFALTADPVERNGDNTPVYIGYELSVGDFTVSGENSNLDDELYALRIQGQEDGALLLVHDYGPSDDDTCACYWYDSEGLKYAGLIGTAAKGIQLSPGMFTGITHGSILQTWYHPMDFCLARSWAYDQQTGASLNPPLVARVPRAFYPMGTQVTLGRDLDLLVSPVQGADVALTVHKGKKAILAASDDVAWVYIEALEEEGDYHNSGWFYLGTDTWTAIPVNGEQVPGLELFDGLLYSD